MIVKQIKIEEANSPRNYVFIVEQDENKNLRYYVISAILGCVELDSVEHLCSVINRVVEGLDSPIPYIGTGAIRG